MVSYTTTLVVLVLSCMTIGTRYCDFLCWFLGRVQQSQLEISASERIFSSNAACRYAALFLQTV